MTAVDLTPVSWPYRHEKLLFVEGDFLTQSWTADNFDLIINCSAVEHVGLGRYGDPSEADGDLCAMQLMLRLLRLSGVMLLTVPIGSDSVVGNLHRVYGTKRLPKLLEGYFVEASEYWIKDGDNRWVLSGAGNALDRRPTSSCYGLGCFVLRKGTDT